jgi:cytochrome c peroxidase
VGGINKGGAVYRGAVPQRFGNRKPPSSAYATQSPLFHYDAAEGLFVGGNFWDGRAAGAHLGNPAADQALGPFLNPVEQNMPSAKAVLEVVGGSRYASLWATVWGEPLDYSTRAGVTLNYDRVGLAIAAYEGSSEVNQFSSRYDAWVRGEATLSEQELWGKELFEGKGMCSACHMAPLFTDYTFDNLGTPKNPANPFYEMDEVYLDDGSPINPEGAAWIDQGLGGFLASLPESYFAGLGLDKAQTVAENLGKHKVPTLRNVDKRPDFTFPKAYMHNGVFKSLKEVVHFYNTRDVEPWPAPEVAENVNTDELGNLGLTDAEEDAIVAFMGTLSDGATTIAPMSAVEPMPSVARADATAAAPGSVGSRIRFVYSVLQPGQVKAVMFDVMGRRVGTLLDEWKAVGQYTLDAPAGGYASGQYYVRIDAAGARQVRKVTVVR